MIVEWGNKALLYLKHFESFSHFINLTITFFLIGPVVNGQYQWSIVSEQTGI